MQHLITTLALRFKFVIVDWFTTIIISCRNTCSLASFPGSSPEPGNEATIMLTTLKHRGVVILIHDCDHNLCDLTMHYHNSSTITYINITSMLFITALKSNTSRLLAYYSSKPFIKCSPICTAVTLKKCICKVICRLTGHWWQEEVYHVPCHSESHEITWRHMMSHDINHSINVWWLTTAVPTISCGVPWSAAMTCKKRGKKNIAVPHG